MKKRILSLVLVVAMVATLFAGLTITASADGNLALSFSFTSAPSGWPSGSSGSANSQTYTVDGTAYTFALGKNVYYNTQKYLMLKATTYLGLPAIDGYKLTKVVVKNSSGCSQKTNVGISSASSSATYLTGGSAQTYSTQSSTYTYTLSDTSANTMYYLYITSANCQITNLELTYAPADAPTHTHNYIWDGNPAVDEQHTLACENTDGLCDALSKTEACTYVNGVCSVCGTAEPEKPKYELVKDASDLAADDKLLIVGIDNTYYALAPYASGNNCGRNAVPAPVLDIISTNVAYLTLGGEAGAWTLYDGKYYLYAAGGTKDNHLKGTANADADTAKWTISCDATSGVATIKCVDTATTKNWLRHNTSSDLFSCYASGQGNIYLYRLNENVCTHEGTTEERTEISATCEEIGHAAGTYCTNCGKYISGGATIAALGHDLDEGTPDPAATCTVAGSLLKSCSRCDYTERSVIPANGHTWGDTECTVCHEPKPAPADFALCDTLKDGDEVILYNPSREVAVKNEMLSNDWYLATTAVAPVEGVISTYDTFIIWTVSIDEETGKVSFSNGDNKIVAWLSGSYVEITNDPTHSGADAAWTISNASVDDHTHLLGTGLKTDGYIQVYSKTIDDESQLVACGFTEAVAATKPDFGFQFYVKGATVACDHEWVEDEVTLEPTCTEDGVQSFVCSKCDDGYKEEPIPNLGGHIDENGDGFCDRENCKAKLNVYTLSTTAPVDGNSYIIVAAGSDGKYYALPNSISETTAVAGVEVQVSGDKLFAVDGIAYSAENKKDTASTPNEGVAFLGASAYLHLNASKIKTASGATNGVFSFASGTAANTFTMTAMQTSKALAFNGSEFVLGATGSDLYFYCKAPHVHSFDNFVSTTATCTEAGKDTYACSCGETEERDAEPLGHIDVDPEDGICDRCTISMTHEHQMDGVVTVYATCKEPGVMTYTCIAEGCTDPAYSYTEEIPATGHQDEDGDGICDICTEEIPSDPYAGLYYIAADGYYATNDLGTNATKRLQGEAVVGDLPESVTIKAADNKTFEIVAVDGGYVLRAVAIEGNNYVGYADKAVGDYTDLANARVFAISEDENGVINFTIRVGDEDVDRYLSSNSQYRYFGWYKSGQKKDLSLIPVTINPDAHEHAYAWNNVIGVDGYHTEVCECGEASRQVACTCAEPVVTPATCKEFSSTTYTCDVCGYEWTEKGTEYADHHYVEGFCEWCGTAEPVAKEYTLVTDAAALKDGDVFVFGATKDGTSYGSGGVTGSNKYLDSVEVTITDDVLTSYDVCEITLEAATDGWYLKLGDKYITATAAKAITLSETASNVWTIDITEEGLATVATMYDTTNCGRFLYNTGSPRFLNYTSATSASMLLPSIYKAASVETHKAVLQPASDPDCENETNGNVEYWYCANCVEGDEHFGKYYTDETLTTEVEGDVIIPFAHSWRNATEADTEAYLAPTCEEKGQYFKVCDVCGKIGDEPFEIDALGHDMVQGEVINPTCTEGGYTEYYCSRDCGTSEHRNQVDPLDHEYIYTNNGDDHTVTCSRCDYNQTEGHNFVEGVCVCGATEALVDEDLTITNIALNMQAYIGAQFRIEPTAAAEYDSVYVVVVQGKQEGDKEFTLTENIDTAGGYLYEHKLPAAEITDLLIATVYGVKDGKIYTGATVENWSAKQAAISRLDTYYKYATDKYPQYKAYCAMFVDMLYYGAEVQKAFSYATDRLATDGVNAKYLALGTKTEPAIANTSSASGSTTTVTVYSKSLAQQASVELQIRFKLPSKASYTKYEVRYTINGRDYVVDGADLGDAGNSSYVLLRIDKIAFPEIRFPVEITVYDKTTGKAASQTFTYSIESFAFDRLGGTFDAMVKELMKFGDSADVYFNKKY